MFREEFDRNVVEQKHISHLKSPSHEDTAGGLIFHTTMIRKEFKEDFVVSCKLRDTKQIFGYCRNMQELF